MDSSGILNLTDHSSAHGQSQTRGQAGFNSSGGDAALPTEDVVRTWDSEDLFKWLTSLTPPPLGKNENTVKTFQHADIDGPLFLDLGGRWFSDSFGKVLPLGVAHRLDMLATSIKNNTLPMSVASSRKRPRSSSPIQSPESKGKNKRVAVDSAIDVPLTQASRITKGSLQPVEELAAARSQAVVQKLAGMSFTS
ncbi:hypothetical protein L211DRAFT_459525 [Terfezia boudieri ATCC MYA-4762]|uniref:SAM domain-containing protein n=1 Tax=Terfezia boudieri ATCC MYA-4762 TaxID=1051890 RepID=A0A3N4LI09_9PEZI|nr:hypothetical protein L211DRAFT_459525 [Terfezia boudieri ATCC MYA-4762]